jgi:hypothetical protein
MKYCLVILFILLTLACDNRHSTVVAPKVHKFQTDLVIVKDSSGVGDFVDIAFKRDSVPFDDALIYVAEQLIPHVATGRYRATSTQITLPYGTSQVRFYSPNDSYACTLLYVMPGPFVIENINPQSNQGGGPVDISWGAPETNEQVKFFVSVVGKNYHTTHSIPLAFDVGVTNNFTLPDTVFENDQGDLEPDIYYVYIGAYTRGFIAYDGIEFPVPVTVPRRTLLNPTGLMGYGRIAPVDSIFVNY